MDKLSQKIIEHARRLYPKALSYKGQLTDKQFYEIERECDVDFYKLPGQKVRFTIRYRGIEPKDGGNELTELTDPFGDSRFGGGEGE